MTDLTDDERDVLLAALFELRITRSAFDDDPDAAGRPFVERISHDTITDLVVKLGGDPDTAMFGAFRDGREDRESPVIEYPGD